MMMTRDLMEQTGNLLMISDTDVDKEIILLFQQLNQTRMRKV